MNFQSKRPNMISWCVILFYCLTVVSSTFANAEQSDEIWQQVSEQCENFDRSVQTLASYLEFQTNYDKLNECLHLNEPPAACLEAEKSCHQNGLLYSAVKILGQLVKRAAHGEPICNLEFSSKMFRLHKQVGENGGSPRLAKHLRTLANRWASRCRKTLAQRLLDVEKRAPDAYKHVNLIVAVLNIGIEKVADLKVEPEHYVPTLEEERALDEKVSSAGGRGASGFHFNTSRQISKAMQALEISCSTLKLYHINMLGSIGLLASIGYGAPRSLDKEPELNRGLVRRWLVSALLCQVLRGVKRMTSTNTEGESRDEILVLPVQEADVSIEAERDKAFAFFGLPEAINGHMELDLEALKPADLYVYKESGRLNSRKVELINGPGYSLAKAIYTYLDLRVKNRMPMTMTVLGLD